MSSLSAIEDWAAPTGRRVSRPADGARLLALGCLMLFAATTQLDAVANKISTHLPFSIVAAVIGALIASTVPVLTTMRGAPVSANRSVGGARLIVALTLWAVVAWTLSLHVSAGAVYLGKFGLAILPALCLMVIVNRAWHIQALVWAIILASAVSAAIVLIEHQTHTRLVATSLAATTADFDGVARSSGGSDQNATTSAQMLMVGATLAAGWLFAGQRRGRLLLLAITLLGGVALALMSARSAVLGFAAASGLILFSLRRTRSFPLILMLAAAAVLGTLMFAPPTLVARFAAIDNFGADPTLYRRVTYLRIGADLLSKSPVWGIGPGNFPLYFITDAYRYMPGRILVPRELHNTYLDVAVEFGLIGFALFAAIVTKALASARSAFSGAPTPLGRVSFAVAVAVAALLVGCFFMPHKDMRYLWMMIALAYRCGAVRAREETAK